MSVVENSQKPDAAPPPYERTTWVGFDLGGTKMLAAVYNDAFEILGKKRRRTKGHEGVERGLERIVRTIERALRNANTSPDSIAGIGIGCPGPFDLQAGVILEAPNLGWYDAPVVEYLENHFGCPVVILNDVDAGVYGEYRYGAGRDARCVVGIFPGTGVGSGCVYQGQIVQGRRSSCMELGHVVVQPHGPMCGCGQYGCLEAVASRLAIAGAAAQAAYRGQAPRLRELAGTDVSAIRSSVLAEAIACGDEVIERIVLDAAAHIGVAVAGVVNLLAPDVIILGGGLVQAMPELFVKPVRDAAKAGVLPSYRDVFSVKAAKLGDDPTILGAAAWIQHIVASAPHNCGNVGKA